MRRIVLTGLVLGAALVGVTPAPAAYPGANGRIAFVEGDCYAGFSNLYSVPVSGRAPKRLGSGWDVSYSPDGRWLASVDSFENRDHVLLVGRVSGGGGSVLWHEYAPPDGLRPGVTWSPDGRRIAFASDQDGDFEIYVMATDGTFQRNWSSSHPGSDRSPAWETVLPPSAEPTRGDPDLKYNDTAPCNVPGTNAHNKLKGGHGVDRICGYGGNDVLDGGGGRDRLEGGKGKDQLFARDGEPDDLVIGGDGHDVAHVDPGDDVFSVEQCKPRPCVEDGS